MNTKVAILMHNLKSAPQLRPRPEFVADARIRILNHAQPTTSLLIRTYIVPVISTINRKN